MDVDRIIFDLSGVNDIDAVAIETLEKLMDLYQGRGIAFLFAGMKGPIRDLVFKAGWNRKYGDRIAYHSLQQAVGIDKKNLDRISTKDSIR